jgi:septum formation protein
MSKLYLASASPRRKELLAQIAVSPDYIIPADVDETPLKREAVNKLTARLAKLKATKVAHDIDYGYIISADTAIEIGGKTLGKADTDEHVRSMISKLSGRKHRVYTTVIVSFIEDNKIVKSIQKTVKTIISLKRITSNELDSYIESKQGIGKEGGFFIQGAAEKFVKSINGSYSNIVGLPLYETNNLLISIGYKSI